MPVWISAAHITKKSFIKVIRYLHRHIFPQNMVKWGCVHSWPGLWQFPGNCSMWPQNWSALSTHQKPTFAIRRLISLLSAAINFHFCSLHMIAFFFSPHSVAEDVLKAHEDHIRAERNVKSPCQLKASILSWAFDRMSFQHDLLTFTSPHQMTWAVALGTSRWRRLGLSHP